MLLSIKSTRVSNLPEYQTYLPEYETYPSIKPTPGPKLLEYQTYQSIKPSQVSNQPEYQTYQSIKPSRVSNLPQYQTCQSIKPTQVANLPENQNVSFHTSLSSTSLKLGTMFDLTNLNEYNVLFSLSLLTL